MSVGCKLLCCKTVQWVGLLLILLSGSVIGSAQDKEASVMWARYDPEAKESILIVASKGQSVMQFAKWVTGSDLTETIAPLREAELAEAMGIPACLKENGAYIFSFTEAINISPYRVGELGLDRVSYPLPYSESLVNNLIMEYFASALARAERDGKREFSDRIRVVKNVDGLKILPEPGKGLLNLGRNDRVWVVTAEGAGVLEGRSALRFLLNRGSFAADVSAQESLNRSALLEGSIWAVGIFLCIGLILGISLALRTGKRRLRGEEAIS